MKYLCRFVILSIVFALSSIPFTMPLKAAVKVPEKIRVGLYFNYSPERMNTAQSDFNVSAAKGTAVGFFKDGSFICVFEESSSNPVTIRKDSYYVIKDGKYTEFTPSASYTVQGSEVGPYHIKIGNDFADLGQALAQVNAYKNAGIKAYPVFTGVWQVWTGFFIDQLSAQQQITNLSAALPGVAACVIPPAADRIAAFDSAGNARFIFGGSSGVFRIRPGQSNNPAVLTINNNMYRGELEVRRFSGSDMTVINVVDLEHYLYGVVPAEIEASSNPEAIKAQAVAARTYAVNNMGSHKSLDFDVSPTTYNQVYKGYKVETAASNKAVDDTAGKLVLYNQKPAEVYYFSSSGGMTEDVTNVWSADLPYLKSVEDKYESGKSWKYNWTVEYTAEKIKSVMLERNYNLGDILSVRITQTSKAGRATQLVITGTKGSKIYEKGSCRSVFSDFYSQWYTISTDADVSIKRYDGTNTTTQLGEKKIVTSSGIRNVLSVGKNVAVVGAGSIKKTYPAVPVKYTFTGKGNGHAIGMSQEGAKGMAKAGYNYVQILQHYFTGTTVG